MRFFSRPGALGFIVSSAVIIVLAVVTVLTPDAGTPWWGLVIAWLAVASWATRNIMSLAPLTRWRWRLGLSVVMATAGALSAGASPSAIIIVAAVGLVQIFAHVRSPLAAGVATLGASAIAVTAGVLLGGRGSLHTVIICLGVLCASALGGFLRRVRRQVEAQNRRIRQQEETARADLERVALARDLHDVLAHSLGGLVIQLDAVEALLENGDVAAARKRVSAAGSLARSGLVDARRAVATLRSATDAPDETPVRFHDDVETLLETHRALGGVVVSHSTGEAHPLSVAAATALHRGVQESLSNARKHAPNAPVRLEFLWNSTGVVLTVSNPITASPPVSSLATTGSGRGLSGMSERFRALAGGAVTAGMIGTEFVVRMEVSLS